MAPDKQIRLIIIIIIIIKTPFITSKQYSQQSTVKNRNIVSLKAN